MAAICLLAAGCTQLKLGDGSKVTSFLNRKTIKSLRYSSTDTNGAKHTLKVDGYSADQVEAMGVIAEGLAAGFAKSLTGGVSLPVPLPVQPPTNAVPETP